MHQLLRQQRRRIKRHQQKIREELKRKKQFRYKHRFHSLLAINGLLRPMNLVKGIKFEIVSDH